MFEKIEYTIKDIQGDYGILLAPSGEEKPVAMFFLPPEAEVGGKVLYENLEYTWIG